MKGLLGVCWVLLAIAQSLSTAAAAAAAITAPKLSADDLDVLGTSFSRGLARAQRQQQAAIVQAAALSEGVSAAGADRSAATGPAAAEPPYYALHNVEDILRVGSVRETNPEPTNKMRHGYLTDLWSRLEGDLEGQNGAPKPQQHSSEGAFTPLHEKPAADSQPQQDEPQPQDASLAPQRNPFLDSPDDSTESDSWQQGNGQQHDIPQPQQHHPLQDSGFEQSAEHHAQHDIGPSLEDPRESRPRHKNPEEQQDGAARGSSFEQQQQQQRTAQGALEHARPDYEGPLANGADGYERGREWSWHHATSDYNTPEQLDGPLKHSRHNGALAELPPHLYGQPHEPEADHEGSYDAGRQPALQHQQDDAAGRHYRLHAPEPHPSHPEYNTQDPEYEYAFEVGGLAGQGEPHCVHDVHFCVPPTTQQHSYTR